MKKRKSIPQYTYRQSSKQEEKIVYRRIALVSLATLAILIVIYFWGLSFINILGLLGGKSQTSSSSTTTSNVYTTPLQKPNLTPIQTPTNSDKIDVSGTTNPDVSVSLTLNGKSFGDSQIADKSGFFKFSAISLKDGINQLVVAVADTNGNKETTSANVVLDKTPPSLTVAKPDDNATFSPGTTSVLVSGMTSDPDGYVYINSIQVTLDPKTGNFNFNLPVTAGQIQIEIKAVDVAGNATIQKRAVTVSPTSTPPTP